MSKRSNDPEVNEDLSENGEQKKPRLLLDNEQQNEEKSNTEESACIPKPAAQKEERIRRRKVVLLLSYSGSGYLGMQRNPDSKTIEGDLLKALRDANIISEDCFVKPQQMLFQRAARTDKGVSAVRQVVSLKLPENADVSSINQHLPTQIRVVCLKRTTKGFNSKVNCDARTYSYVLPTYSFAPVGSETDETFRISDCTISQINKVLKMYIGTHNFHNFTLKKSFKDPSAKRYIQNFSCGQPFVCDGVEFITLTVKGQSFMQHHIRKMIGLAIAVVRGHTTEDTILRAFKSEPLDIPKAPGLGLMLEEVHYERYNTRFGGDGLHEKLEWSKYNDVINDFKDKFIINNILRTEIEEKSMLNWIATLPGHSYSVREDKTMSEPSLRNEQEETHSGKADGTNLCAGEVKSVVHGSDLREEGHLQELQE